MVRGSDPALNRVDGASSHTRSRDERASLVVFALALALLVALPLAHRFLPLVDWPQHLAQDAIVAHQGDASFASDLYYRTTGWFLPYQGFRWLHVALSRALGDDWLAGRAALSLSLGASALALLAIARALGRSAWTAVVGCALLVEANLLWGFAPYVLGTTLQLWQLALVLRWLLRAPTERSSWTLPSVCVLGVATFFTHSQPAAIECVSLVVLALWGLRKRALDRGAALRLALAIAPVALLLAAYLLAGGWLSGQAIVDEFRVDRPTVWRAPWVALFWLKLCSGLDALGHWPAIAVALSLLAAWRAARAGAADPHTQNQDERTITALRESVARSLPLVFFGLYFALPDEFRGQSLAPRVASLSLLSLSWAFAWRAPPLEGGHARWTRGYRRARAVAALSVLGALGWAHVRFAQFDRELRPVEAAVATLPRGARVATLAYETHLDGFGLPVFLHAGAYSVALRGGMSSMGFTRTGVTYRSEVPRGALTVMELWAPSANGWQLDPSTHGTFYDAVLVVRGARYPGHPFRGGASSGVRARRVFSQRRIELWRVER